MATELDAARERYQAALEAYIAAIRHHFDLAHEERYALEHNSAHSGEFPAVISEDIARGEAVERALEVLEEAGFAYREAVAAAQEARP